MSSHGVLDLVVFTGNSDAKATRDAWSINHVQVDPAVEPAVVTWEQSSDGLLVSLAGRGLVRTADSVWTRYVRMEPVRRVHHKERFLHWTTEFEAIWNLRSRRGSL